MSIALELLFIVGILTYVLRLPQLNDIVLKSVCWAGLIFRVGFTYGLYYISFLNGNGGFWAFVVDEVYYHKTGGMIADLLLSGQLPRVYVYNGYPYLVGLLYSLFGKHLLVAGFFNNLLGVLIVILGYITVKKIYSVKAARLTCVMLAFFPSHILFSTRVLKDSLVTFMFLVSISLAIKAFEQRNNYLISLLNLSVLVILFEIRNYAAVLLAFSCLAGLVYHVYKSKRSSLLMPIGGYITFLIYGGWKMLTGTGIANEAAASGSIAAVDKIRIQVYAIGNTAIDESTRFVGFNDILAYLPKGITNVLFQPFPWKWLEGSVIQKATAPEMIIWYLLIPLAVMGIPRAWRQNREFTFVLLIFVFLLSAAYGVVVANIGAVYRLRMLIQVIAFIFASISLADKDWKVSLWLSSRPG